MCMSARTYLFRVRECGVNQLSSHEFIIYISGSLGPRRESRIASYVEEDEREDREERVEAFRRTGEEEAVERGGRAHTRPLGCGCPIDFE